MSKTTTAGVQSVERRLHTRHRARTTVYITTPTGRKKLCRAINLSATGGTLSVDGKTITLPAGVASAAIKMTPVDDSAVELTENVSLTVAA